MIPPHIRTSAIPLLAFFLLLLSPSCVLAQSLTCTRVVDGDTIILSNGEKVMLIGVDTPETVWPNTPVEYYGKEASAFTRKMVEGKPVRLEYDWQQRDEYGKLLAYVYLNDGTFLNAEIIKQGYGHAYTRFPFKYLHEFIQYEKDAREAKKGLWADGTPKKERKLIKEEYIGSKQSKIYHWRTCSIAQKIAPADSMIFYSVKKAVDAGYLPCKSCRPPYYK
jgi:micrococcal nuclease